MPEADEGVVDSPLVAPLDSRPLDAPERPRRRILARRHALTRVLHLVGERVQDADHDDAIGARVEAAVHGRGDLMPAVQDTGVREHDDASSGERRSKVPLPRALQTLERPALAHRVVLAPVELVDLSLQTISVELHRSGAGRTVYAKSAPNPMQ